jgi:hypothetical protein
MTGRRLLPYGFVLAGLIAGSAACGPSAPNSGPEVRRAVSERFLACNEEGSLILLAQSVPSATLVPCVERYPPGWVLDEVPVVRSGFGSFTLSSDIAGARAVTVTLTRTCDVGGAIHSDDLGVPQTQRWFEYLHPPSPATGYDLIQYYRFAGGCVTYHYVFQPGTPGTFVAEVDSSLGFARRVEVAQFVGDEFGQTLCGPPPDTCVP